MADTIDLNKIGTFIQVVDAQGFTAAARILGQPKSSVSRSVRQLEETLGVRLLHRTTRQVRLTDAGRRYYSSAARALNGLTDATRAVTREDATVSGTVRITAPADIAAWLLGPVVAAFTQKYPSVRVEVLVTGRLVDLVGEGVDLALRVGQLRDSSYIVKSVKPLDAGLFASRGYLDVHGTPRTPADLRSHQLVAATTDSRRLSWTLVDAKGRTERVTGHASIAADDFSFVYGAVYASAGIGLLPVHGCHAEQALVRVLPSYTARGGPLQLLYPSARHVPQRVLLLRDAILTHIEGQCKAHGK